MNPQTAPALTMLLIAHYPHAQLVRVVSRMEELGFDGLWYGDERLYMDPFTGLAACATATNKLRLGPAVSDPYSRHPALVAAAIASLDDLSGGRAILGYGAGIVGFKNLGLQRPHPSTALREGVKMIRRLLAGETVTYEGKVNSLWDAKLQFPTRAGVPLYVAADGPHNLRMAGDVADGVIMMHCASAPIWEDKVRQTQSGRREAGIAPRPKYIARLDVSVSRDRAAALRQAKVRLVRYLWARYPNIAYLQLEGLELPPALDRALRDAGPMPLTHDYSVYEPFADLVSDELVHPIAIAGTPDEVTSRIREIATRADEVMLYPLVPRGETIESVIELLGDVTRTPAHRAS